MLPRVAGPISSALGSAQSSMTYRGVYKLIDHIDPQLHTNYITKADNVLTLLFVNRSHAIFLIFFFSGVSSTPCQAH